MSNTNITNKQKLPNADDRQGSKPQAIRDEVEDILKELHQLLEATAITKEEYEEQKTAILHKMQGL